MTSNRSSLSALPFDVLTLIVPYLDIFDLARLRLVSRNCYQTYADDELCRFALTRLVPTAPEAQVSEPTTAEFDKLVSRTARWMKQQPTQVERIAVPKNCSSPGSVGWGVSGDLLIYQSASGDKDVSQLVIKDLSRKKASVSVDLGALNQQFTFENLQHPSNKWKIWIPKSSVKGDSFVFGQQTRPSKILVTSGFWSLPTAEVGGFDWRTGRVKTEPAPNEPTQALAIVSIDEENFGKVVCHWSSADEVIHFTINSKYFAYVTKENRHKYRMARLDKLSLAKEPLNFKTEDLSTYAFPKEKRITSLGADIRGRYLFVGFGQQNHIVQIIDVKTGASLKKITLDTPSLIGFPVETVADIKVQYRFLQPADTSSFDSHTTQVELLCRYSYSGSCSEDDEKHLSMAKWTITARSAESDTTIADVEVQTILLGGQAYSFDTDSNHDISSLAIDKQDNCFTVASVFVPTPSTRSRPRYGGAYHQQRGFPPKRDRNAKVPAVITTVYDTSNTAAFEISEECDKDAEAKSWLKPVSTITLRSRSSTRSASRPSSRSNSRERCVAEIPAPTVHKSPAYVGCGWVVFSKDRSDQCNAKNLFGRLGAVKRTDELVIVRFD